MNLIEAIKSGRPFRRAHWEAGEFAVLWETHTNGLGVMFGKDWYAFRGSDLTADDYELQEQTVTITRSQLEAALKDAFTVGPAVLSGLEGRSLVSYIAQKLGLGDAP